MTKRLGFVVLAAGLFLALAGGSCLPAQAEVQKYTEVVRLSHIKPIQMMLLLGLYSQKDVRTGRSTPWTAEAAAPETNSIVPEGVDFIMPYERDCTLVVKGDREGIDGLKALVSKLDVKPRGITIQAYAIRLTPRQIESLGVGSMFEGAADGGDLGHAFCRAEVCDGLRSAASKHHIKVVGPVTVEGANNAPSDLKIGRAGTAGYIELTLLPRVSNADMSVSLAVFQPGSDAPMFSVRVGKGDCAVLSRAPKGSERGLLLIVRPSLK